MGEGELDLLPMMNVFIVLIPMLLTSAVFLKVTVIDTNVPSATGTAPADAGASLSLPKTRYQDIIAVMDVARASGLPSASLLGASMGD